MEIVRRYCGQLPFIQIWYQSTSRFLRKWILQSDGRTMDDCAMIRALLCSSTKQSYKSNKANGMIYGYEN